MSLSRRGAIASVLEETGITVLPSAPTIGTAVAGSGAALVTWTAPGSGTPITGYLITPSSGSPQTVGNVTSFNFPGLTNGTAYTFTVAAINVFGTGSPSGASNSVTPSGASSATYDTSTYDGAVYA